MDEILLEVRDFAHLNELCLILKDLKDFVGEFSTTEATFASCLGNNTNKFLAALECSTQVSKYGDYNIINISKLNREKAKQTLNQVKCMINGVFWGHPTEVSRGWAFNVQSLATSNLRGANVYIGRATIDGGVHLGAVQSNHGGEIVCHIGYGGSSRSISKGVEVLCVSPWSKLQLITYESRGGEVPMDSIAGGNEEDFSSLYPALVEHHGTGIWVGKIRPGFNGCHIGYQGKEIEVPVYKTVGLSGTDTLLVRETLKLLSGKVNRSFETHGFFDTFDQVSRHISSSTTAKRTVQRVDGRPRVLHCHDMKGGYCQWADEIYRKAFTSWDKIDLFCYFSHHFVSIPPKVWIDDCSKHEKVCIGTLITEGQIGRKNSQLILQHPEAFAEKLTVPLKDLCEEFGFHGWLINLESPVNSSSQVVNFLKLLTNSCKRRIGDHATIIYYDSLDTAGRVRYQNCLNYENKAYFDACDGIFTNYWWTGDMVMSSLELAQRRKFDVFIGIDVFARGRVIHKEGFGCATATSFLNQLGASTAIFAPGWVLEKGNQNPLPEESARQDREFWSILFPESL